MLKIEREIHVFPIELAEDGRVRREAEGPAIRIMIGRIFLTFGLITKIRRYT